MKRHEKIRCCYVTIITVKYMRCFDGSKPRYKCFCSTAIGTHVAWNQTFCKNSGARLFVCSGKCFKLARTKNDFYNTQLLTSDSKRSVNCMPVYHPVCSRSTDRLLAMFISLHVTCFCRFGIWYWLLMVPGSTWSGLSFTCDIWSLVTLSNAITSRYACPAERFLCLHLSIREKETRVKRRHIGLFCRTLSTQWWFLNSRGCSMREVKFNKMNSSNYYVKTRVAVFKTLIYSRVCRNRYYKNSMASCVRTVHFLMLLESSLRLNWWHGHP